MVSCKNRNKNKIRCDTISSLNYVIKVRFCVKLKTKKKFVYRSITQQELYVFAFAVKDISPKAATIVFSSAVIRFITLQHLMQPGYHGKAADGVGKGE